MATAEAKAIYRQRASTAEWVNALARERGLQRIRVRGEERARSVVQWFALAHNLVRAATLRATPAA
jgi:IS5 family transposase